MLLEEAPLSYYRKKIAEIKEDLKDNERQITKYYNYKGEYITEWAGCLEKLHPHEYAKPIDTICQTIVSDLVSMGLTKGVPYVYEILSDKYKNKTRSEIGQLGAEVKNLLGNPSKITSDINNNLPFDISSLDMASPEQLQENESFIRDRMEEWRRRHTEYVKIMHDRRIAIINQKESEVESTATPYNPREGHFYNEALAAHGILSKFADTFLQMAQNIRMYPPQSRTHEVRTPEDGTGCSCNDCELEDLDLAKGLQNWVMFYQALYEFHRPYADKKFSSSYVKWFRTEILNNEHGKHAAAVMSKVTSYLGEERELTREQVGDKLTELYRKMIRFAGALEMQRWFIEDLPDVWHERLQIPCVADRKIRVSPILSEGAFGSDKR